LTIELPTSATSQKLAGSIPDVIDISFLNLPNLMALVFTQPLTEVNTRKSLGGGVKLGRRVSLTTSPPSEPIAWKMWDIQSLTTLQAFTPCLQR
jgi:hypothetical protein